MSIQGSVNQLIGSTIGAAYAAKNVSRNNAQKAAREEANLRRQKKITQEQAMAEAKARIQEQSEQKAKYMHHITAFRIAGEKGYINGESVDFDKMSPAMQEAYVSVFKQDSAGRAYLKNVKQKAANELTNQELKKLKTGGGK